MRFEEARRISEILKDLPLPEAATILNIGSSTRYFREVMQPHIQSELIGPLVASGFRLLHCDIKNAEGVDIVGDLLEPSFHEKLTEYRADVLLCCNILEHIADPATFARACVGIVRDGGFIIASVPYSYPYHRDPIDTGLRPNPAELSELFPGLKLVVGEILTSTTYIQDCFTRPNGIKTLLSNLFKMLVPIFGLKGWPERAHRFLWLWRPYQVSIVVLHKCPEQ